MENIEREVKILNVDVSLIKEKLSHLGVTPKWQYIQDIYTYDLPTVDENYINAVEQLINKGDTRFIYKLLNDIDSCFGEKDKKIISSIIGVSDIKKFVDDENSDYSKLKSNELIELMKVIEKERFSKWIRLRQTGEEVTLAIKKVVENSEGYELEIDVPDIETGKSLLEDLGYFFQRHQTKMRIAYDYKDTEIVIDKWPFLSPYIEIEGNTKEGIYEVVKDLGFNEEDAVVTNTEDLYVEKNIDIYSDEYRDLSFSADEREEVESYMN